MFTYKYPRNVYLFTNIFILNKNNEKFYLQVCSDRHKTVDSNNRKRLIKIWETNECDVSASVQSFLDQKNSHFLSNATNKNLVTNENDEICQRVDVCHQQLEDSDLVIQNNNNQKSHKLPKVKNMHFEEKN